MVLQRSWNLRKVTAVTANHVPAHSAMVFPPEKSKRFVTHIAVVNHAIVDPFRYFYRGEGRQSRKRLCVCWKRVYRVWRAKRTSKGRRETRSMRAAANIFVFRNGIALVSWNLDAFTLFFSIHHTTLKVPVYFFRFYMDMIEGGNATNCIENV